MTKESLYDFYYKGNTTKCNDKYKEVEFQIKEAVLNDKGCAEVEMPTNMLAKWIIMKLKDDGFEILNESCDSKTLWIGW